MISDAANQGEIGACETLGDIYQTGKVVTQDFKQAAEWFSKSNKLLEQELLDVSHRLGEQEMGEMMEMLRKYVCSRDEPDTAPKFDALK